MDFDLSKLSYRGFQKFISEQNPATEINQELGYDECAVGLYVQSKFKNALSEPTEFYNFCNNFVKTLEPLLAKIFPDADLCRKLFPTWKEVQLYTRSAHSSWELMEEIKERGSSLASHNLCDAIANRRGRGCKVSQYIMDTNPKYFNFPRFK